MTVKGVALTSRPFLFCRYIIPFLVGPWIRIGMDKMVLTARWVMPVVAPPLERGTITICGNNIVAVEAQGARAPDIDLGNAAIIPGLVNAHTHLDLSGLRNTIPPSADFIGWLKSVINHRRDKTPEQIGGDVRAGLHEAMRLGTTLIADISAAGMSFPLLREAPCRSVVFREILGLQSCRVMSVWNEAIQWLSDHPDTETCAGALSPHAPYSVHHSIIRACGVSGALQTIHLAETRAELQLLESRSGPFVPFLQDLGVFDEDGIAPSFDWILWRMRRAPSLLIAHGNYLDPEQAIPENATIVYCPRTHAAFGHPPHPFREFLARGIRVALGTDSLASNPDLDVLAEASFVHERFPDFAPDRLLRMATLSGAEALGWDRDTGSLERGKSADLVVVPLADVEAHDPYHLLFERGNSANAPRRTMWRGQWRD